MTEGVLLSYGSSDYRKDKYHLFRKFNILILIYI